MCMRAGDCRGMLERLVIELGECFRKRILLSGLVKRCCVGFRFEHRCFERGVVINRGIVFGEPAGELCFEQRCPDDGR